MKYCIALVTTAVASLMIAGCGGGGGGDGGGSGQPGAGATAQTQGPGPVPQTQGTGNIPQALIGKWRADVPIAGAGRRCANGELQFVEEIRTLEIRADGSANFSAVRIDNGVTDGCSPATGGTCNTTDELEFHMATVAVGGQDGTTLTLNLGLLGTEMFTSLCNAALNTSRQIQQPPISVPWAVITSPNTGRPALKVPGAPFSVTCPNILEGPNGNDCPTILLEQVR